MRPAPAEIFTLGNNNFKLNGIDLSGVASLVGYQPK